MSNRWKNRNKQNKVIYNILNITENTKERDCISADKKNEKKYRETIEKLGNATKVWENTGVMFNMEVPPPPQPNNYDRLVEYRKKNVLRPAIKQSEATIYLFQRGYTLGEDYEAHQAIEVVKKLQSYENNLNQEDRMESFPNINSESYLQKIKKSKNRKSVNPNVNLGMLNMAENIEKKRQSTINLSHQVPNHKSNTIQRKSNSFYKTLRRKNTLNQDIPVTPTNPDTNIPQNESNSSIDSLFDEEELKQFEKNHENEERKKRFDSNVNNFEYLSNQNKYNGIYPDLKNLMSPEFCSL